MMKPQTIVFKHQRVLAAGSTQVSITDIAAGEVRTLVLRPSKISHVIIRAAAAVPAVMSCGIRGYAGVATDTDFTATMPDRIVGTSEITQVIRVNKAQDYAQYEGVDAPCINFNAGGPMAVSITIVYNIRLPYPNN